VQRLGLPANFIDYEVAIKLFKVGRREREKGKRGGRGRKGKRREREGRGERKNRGGRRMIGGRAEESPGTQKWPDRKYFFRKPLVHRKVRGMFKFFGNISQ
jgi:hypothetical protein